MLHSSKLHSLAMTLKNFTNINHTLQAKHYLGENATSEEPIGYTELSVFKSLSWVINSWGYLYTHTITRTCYTKPHQDQAQLVSNSHSPKSAYVLFCNVELFWQLHRGVQNWPPYCLFVGAPYIKFIDTFKYRQKLKHLFQFRHVS